MNALLVVVILLGCIYLVAGIDDLFIDFASLFLGARPQRLDAPELEAMTMRRERRLALIIPAWDESAVIRRMLLGNLARVRYLAFDVFVGVYPNDPDTITEVAKVSAVHPRVKAVVNDRPGPSSKGQLLNHVVRHILAQERQTKRRYDGFVMQDAEDVMHPLLLKLANQELRDFDFVQTPVFSLEVRQKQLVAGVYVDEFAEAHTKDLLVRERLGAAVPSAGVGTVLSRPLVRHMLRYGDLFNEKSLTEDYELGVRAHAAGFAPRFACCYTEDENGVRDFIATREYFPKTFRRSVRQKTRWTVGVALHGWRNLQWPGTLTNRYFLLRDRRGIVTNAAVFAGYVTATVVIALPLAGWHLTMPETSWQAPLAVLFGANSVLTINRLTQRIRCAVRVYGWRGAALVPLRWPVGSVINAFACIRAVRQEIASKWTAKAIAWSKTEHELPAAFGEELPSPGHAALTLEAP